MTIQKTGIQSFTGAAGNTWYYGGASVQGEHRAFGRAGVAVDLGSDGTIDGAAGVRGATGPRGTRVQGAYAGPHSAGAAGIATNGEMTRRWSRYVQY